MTGNRSVLKRIILGVIFLVLVLIIFLILQRLRPVLEGPILSMLKIEPAEFEKEINSVFLAVSGFVSTSVTAFFTAAGKHIFNRFVNAPHISFSEKGLAMQNLSGIKKDAPFNFQPRVEIGSHQKDYRIVYAKVTNTGDKAISRVTICGKHIADQMTPSQSQDLYIMIHDVRLTKAGNSGRYEYKVPYIICDGAGRKHRGKTYLCVDLENCNVAFAANRRELYSLRAEYRAAPQEKNEV